MRLMNKAKIMFTRAKNAPRKISRHFYSLRLRKKFHNPTLSVFSANCIGACMLHDLGAAFNSPFVNLCLYAEDYIKFLKDPQKYLALEFEEIERQFDYPMARLGDLTFRFVHYSSFEQAVADFKRRVPRINYDNLFVMFAERDGCTYELLKEFDSLPYAHKIVFTHLPYEDIQSSFYIKGYENMNCLGNIIDWDKKLGRRIYDQFDFAQWLNG